MALAVQSSALPRVTIMPIPDMDLKSTAARVSPAESW
jgi:hypothetical protein